jgi:3-oxoacyl-[acyl-carrier-protein] synthase II
MMNIHRRRIVVTGIGVIAPCGLTIETFWDAVVAGRPSASLITRFRTKDMPIRIASELKGFDPTKYIDRVKARRFDPAVLYGLAASKDAVADSGLELDKMDRDRVGVVEGTSVCGLSNCFEAHESFMKVGYRGVHPTRTVSAFAGGGSSEISIELQVTGQATTLTTACSSGNDALTYAAHSIRDGLADVMIAGADEAPIIATYYSLFINSGILSGRNGDPSRAMRPFDRDRDGFVLGEGACFLVLEELNHALARGARIYCEWIGHGQSCDAYSSVAIHPEGKGMARAIERAMFDANLPIDAIDYVNCHGSATKTNEVIETQVYKRVLKHRAETVAFSATKPVTGHLMGATAAVEAAICALSVYHGIIPPTANLENPIPGCDLDCVPGDAREFPVRNAMNVSLGFGGKSSALIFSRYDGK